MLEAFRELDRYPSYYDSTHQFETGLKTLWKRNRKVATSSTAGIWVSLDTQQSLKTRAII